ncbi:LysR substrate-binding domain-containing protein [Paucibacter sp. Y2R2-4]|uniref:LysR substrate-binding domain-containing protein n=1 Tax=Paucibacter sp. Y2R2-4 TaxID=2893553 RepID=UPI0021E464AD|nr:LysR substrate-binding domain-containing protein [Paucibacter sp. Y2R2-4]MCV2349167.1 LysR family transcriptional regulator [Paucibacter sp. Y2R2-4]
MRRNLAHHLNGLRFFEAAARHLSFTRAAEELCVTQAAVSHQVRALEEALSLQLFERRPRQVNLSPAGTRLLAVLSSSFDHIESVLDELKRQGSSSLQLAVTPSFSSRWLMPRLPHFWGAHPDIELHLHHTAQADALARGAADAAIIWTHGSPEKPGRLWAQRLFGTALSPVCAPGLARPDAPLSEPEALRHYPLLHEDSFEDWQRWMQAAGVADARVQQGPVIDDSNALLMAAMSGRGVALGRLALVADDLRSGRLIRPFECSIEADGAYWLIASQTTAEQPRFKALAAFLQAEAKTPTEHHPG